MYKLYTTSHLQPSDVTRGRLTVLPRPRSVTILASMLAPTSVVAELQR